MSTVGFPDSTVRHRTYRLMASDSGADAFVNKRVIIDALLAAIGDVFRRRLLWR